jgi:endonuclease/exonuclease/phosphatase family metal-dependent hydrolase
VAFDPYAPYGDVVETTLRVVTWNVWGRYGQWELREAGLEDTLRQLDADIVCLVESWATPDGSQVDEVGEHLRFEHRVFVGDWPEEGWTSGLGLVSRWPVIRHELRALRADDAGAAGAALFALLDGPRGPIQLFVVMLDYPLHGSAVRQAQVRELCTFVDEVAQHRHATVVCGDFNAAPDSDEIRMLTGRSATPVEGLVFYDAWEVAGDGGPGYTWSNQNALSAVGMYPDRRFDYVLSAWPRRGAVGHPTRCDLVGVGAGPTEPSCRITTACSPSCVTEVVTSISCVSPTAGGSAPDRDPTATP